MKQLFRRISNIGSRSNGSHGTANSMFGHSIDQMLVKDHVTSGSQHHHQNDHHYHHHKQRAGASSINVASMTIVGSAESLEKEVPVVLKNFVEYLSSKEAVTMEGLFRVAAPVKQVKELRESMEKTGSMDFSKLDPYDGIHIVASVFKQWIRDIPDGVVPRKYFQQLLDCGASAAKLRDVVRSMPQPNRDFLEYLMKYLLKVVSYSSKNLMTVQNLVIVFAPNLFKCPSAPSPSSPNGNPEKYLVESMQVTKIMANIMENFHEIFQTEDSKFKLESRSSLSSKASKTVLNEEPHKTIENHQFSVADRVKLKDDSRNSDGNKTDLLPDPIPTSQQRQQIDEAVSKTVAAMLFSNKPNEPLLVNLDKVKRISQRKSQDNGALIVELKKKLGHSDEQPDELVKALAVVDADQIFASNHVQTNEGVNNSPLLKSMTKSRPKPPGRRPPSAPVDPMARIGVLFDKSVHIMSDCPNMPSVKEITSAVAPPPNHEPENIRVSPSIGSLKSELDHASQKKSVTFSDGNISTSKRMTPPPPPPKKPAPAAPVIILKPVVLVENEESTDKLKEIVVHPTPSSDVESPENLTERSLNDGDDELSGLRENEFDSCNYSDEESHDVTHSHPMNSLSRKPIGSIPTTSTTISAPVSASTALDISPTSQNERNALGPMKWNPVIPNMNAAPITESLTNSHAYSSSPALDRIGSPSSASISAHRRASYRTRSTGSPRSQKSTLIPLIPLPTASGNESRGESSRTLGNSWKSDGSLGIVASHDLPSDVINSPYLSHKIKRLSSSKEKARANNPRISNASLVEKALESNEARRSGNSSSQEPPRKSNSVEEMKTVYLLNDKDSRRLIEEEFRALKSKIKLLKSTGADIHKVDRLRYKHLSGLIKELHHDDNSEASTTSLLPIEQEGASQSTLQISAKSSLERLARKRLRDRRPNDIEDMSVEQMMEEKTAVKRELAHLKAMFKDSLNLYTQDDKEVMRELYSRYCELKTSIESRMELSTNTQRTAQESRTSSTSELEQYALLRHEKKMLQLHLHKFQDDFVKQNGRRVKTVEDRAPVQVEYKRYKELRSVIDEMENRLKMDVNSLEEEY